jgi:hypothetical protein
MALRLNGSSSGYVELNAPAAAGSNTLTLPTGNGSADQVLSTNGSGTLSFVDRGRMVQGTAVASTSGTSIDFTGIPSWAKRVTVMLNGVSTNGTSNPLIQLGASSGMITSGYVGTGSECGASTAASSFTTGFGIRSALAANTLQGVLHLFCLNVSSNIWVASGVTAQPSSAFTHQIAGTVTLSGTLDRVRITTTNGTDTFDAGSINILYEG